MTTMNEIVRDTVAETVQTGVNVLHGAAGDAARGRALPGLEFSTGLATTPRILPRQALGLGAQLVVPPGTWALMHATEGEQRTFTPGSYWLWAAPGPILVQWVDARRQEVPLGPIEGWSADKWRVRLWLVIDVAVSDPTIIAAHREPLRALLMAARTATLGYIEQHTHAALTGREGNVGGMEHPSQIIGAQLRADPALAGLEMINVRVVERQGDERQIEAATAATVEAAQIDEALRVAEARRRARLHELESQATIGEREHSLRMANTAAAAREQLLQQQADVQQATLAARLEIVMAQIRAQTSEIAHDEQVWQAEQSRLQGEWDRVQRQLLEGHHTDQQVRLLDAQQGFVRVEGETALAVQERSNTQLLALAEIQQRIAEQRALQAQVVAERRDQHERSLLELHLRHEQLVAEQMQRLEQWRAERIQVNVQQQRQHDRQLAGIVGTAQIAAAAATTFASETPASAEQREVAEAGLRMLQDFSG